MCLNELKWLFCQMWCGPLLPSVIKSQVQQAGPCRVFLVCGWVCMYKWGGESVAALAGLRGVSALPHGTSWQSYIPTAHIHTQARTHTHTLTQIQSHTHSTIVEIIKTTHIELYTPHLHCHRIALLFAPLLSKYIHRHINTFVTWGHSIDKKTKTKIDHPWKTL